MMFKDPSLEQLGFVRDNKDFTKYILGMQEHDVEPEKV